MNAKRWLLLLGTVGAAAAATGCKDTEVRKYLGPDGEMYKYLDRLSDAVCQLELKSTGLDPAKRICTGSGPGDKVTPPVYPK